MRQPPGPENLKNLLPAGTMVVLSARSPAEGGCLPAVEQAATATMQPARRREFVHGRTCARAALIALGIPEPVIPVGAHREPLWPDGIVGSITHCGAVAAAAAARREDLGGLGIDLETDEPLEQDTLPMICRATESDWLTRAADAPRLAKLLFSAKESIYKCLWPIVGHFVDFRDIAIHIDTGSRTFVPVEWRDDLPGAVVGCIRGRYHVQEGWIMTTACLAGAGAEG